MLRGLIEGPPSTRVESRRHRGYRRPVPAHHTPLRLHSSQHRPQSLPASTASIGSKGRTARATLIRLNDDVAGTNTVEMMGVALFLPVSRAWQAKSRYALMPKGVTIARTLHQHDRCGLRYRTRKQRQQAQEVQQ